MLARSIDRLLIANRAEIAHRIIRSASLKGIETVCLYSDADAQLPYVSAADRAVRLCGNSPVETYLDIDKVIEAAKKTNCDGIHPGYGFLSENAGFARRCIENGLVFVGPSPDAIETMGSKLASKELARLHSVPTLESLELEKSSFGEAKSFAEKIGYPVLIKASAGGGGRGMRIVEREDELKEATQSARREAQSAFGDGTVFIEKYLIAPRHIEIQIAADLYGDTVHLYERECSIQRRHQKIIEESPSPFLARFPQLRDEMGSSAIACAKAVAYSGVGTVEFVVDEKGNFYFLEMNTRLQVEHPVTEAVTGLDLVEIQLDIAQGDHIEDIVGTAFQHGHAIEARLYAENPDDNWLPQSGKLYKLEIPSSSQFSSTYGVRVDAGFESGNEVSTHYDSMIAKVISQGKNRSEATKMLCKSLRSSEINGLTTNRDLLIAILESNDFVEGQTDTGFLLRNTPETLFSASKNPNAIGICAIAGAMARQAKNRESAIAFAQTRSGWRNSYSIPQSVDFGSDDRVISIKYQQMRSGFEIVNLDELGFSSCQVLSCSSSSVTLEIEGITYRVSVQFHENGVYTNSTIGSFGFVELPKFPWLEDEQHPGSLISPMPGSVVRIGVSVGDHIEAGTTLLVLEAMKMEHSVEAPISGRIAEILVGVGDQVEASQLLVELEEDS